MLQKGSVIKLDNNNEYVVVSIVTYEDSSYVYVMNLKDNKDFMFCRYDGDNLNEVKDGILMEKLLLLFTDELIN